MMANDKSRFGSPEAQDANVSPFLPWLVAVAFFMQMLDGTILNTALNEIAKSLHRSPMEIQSVIVAYMLTVAILIPASGWLVDRFGARRVMTAAIGLFTGGSLLCALSSSLSFLVLSRIIQGAGGALMVPTGRLVLLRVYSRNDLVAVMSFVAMLGMIGSMLGPSLGGFFVEYTSWHWIFLSNIPVGVMGLLMTRAFMPDVRFPTSARFDWGGFALFSFSMFVATFGLEGIDNFGLSVPVFITLLIVAFVCQVVYWKFFAGRKNAVLGPEAFSRRRFSVGIVGNIFTRLGSSAVPYLNPLFMQLVLGFSPLKTGLVMTPLAITSLAAKPLTVPLLKRFGFKRVLLVNTALQGALIASFSTLSLEMSLPEYILHLSLLGAVNSVQFSSINTFTLVDLSESEASSGNALLSVVMQLCLSLAVGVATLLLYLHMPHGATAPAELLGAFQATYFHLGLVTLVSSLIFLFAPKD